MKAPADPVARINAMGLRHLTQALLPRMPEDGGVVNVASIPGAERPRRLEPHRALAATQDFAAGRPGWRSTPGPQETCYRYFKEAPSSDEVAAAIGSLCSDAARWLSGVNLPVDGGLASTCV